MSANAESRFQADIRMSRPQSAFEVGDADRGAAQFRSMLDKQKL